MSGTTTTRTTTTTTTIEGSYLERRRKAPWWPVALGALGLLGIGLYGGIPLRHTIERDLEGRTQSQALTALGLPDVKVNFTGRDGELTGTVPAGTDIEALKKKVLDVTGVRVVSVNLTSAGGATPTPSASATSGPSPSATVESPSASPSTESSSPSASPSATAAAASPAINAVITKGKVVLTGKVPSQDVAAALVADAEKTFGAGNVSNQLTVDAGTSDAGLASLGGVFAALGKGSEATVALADGGITLTGSVASDAIKTAAGDAAAKVTGDAAKVKNELKVSDLQTKLNNLPPIQFQTAYSTLTPAGYRIVQQAAALLKQYPDAKVRIEGHTDDVGTDAVNQELSVARGATVRQVLRSLGIADDRMSYAGFGETRPKVPNTSDANRAINRRVEFVVL